MKNIVTTDMKADYHDRETYNHNQIPKQLLPECQTDIKIKLVAYDKSKEDLIYSTMFAVLLKTHPYDAMDKNVFYALFHPFIASLIAKSWIVIAVDPEDESQAFGYIMGDPEKRCLYWILTKPAFKRLGIGTFLMYSLFGSFDIPIKYTLWTPAIGHREICWNLEKKSHLLLEQPK